MLLDLLGAERVEDDDVVDAVEEFGLECLTQRAHDLRLDERPVAARVLEDERRADVRRHDDDGVAEVDGAPLRIGQPAVVEDLQENVEDVRMGLLDLVE